MLDQFQTAENKAVRGRENPARNAIGKDSLNPSVTPSFSDTEPSPEVREESFQGPPNKKEL